MRYVLGGRVVFVELDELMEHYEHQLDRRCCPNNKHQLTEWIKQQQQSEKWASRVQYQGHKCNKQILKMTEPGDQRRNRTTKNLPPTIRHLAIRMRFVECSASFCSSVEMASTGRLSSSQLNLCASSRSHSFAPAAVGSLSLLRWCRQRPVIREHLIVY